MTSSASFPISAFRPGATAGPASAAAGGPCSVWRGVPPEQAASAAASARRSRRRMSSLTLSLVQKALDLEGDLGRRRALLEEDGAVRAQDLDVRQVEATGVEVAPRRGRVPVDHV